MKGRFQVLVAVAVLVLGAHLLGVLPGLNGDVQIGEKCILTLPFGYVNINHNVYYTWFGKVGTSKSGKTF